MKIFIVCCSLLLWLFLFFSSLAFAASSVNVPLDSWVYPALEKLEAYGLVDSAMSGTKPFSRLEVARMVGEAMEKWQEAEPKKKISGFAEKELIPSLLERFKIEFKRELVERGFMEGGKTPTFLKPVDEIVLRYEYQSHNPIVRPQFPGSNPPNQSLYPINNNDGIVYQKGSNFTGGIRGEARLWEHISFYYEPIFKALGDENSQVGLEKGYMKAEALNLELEVGRDPLWWGPGYTGALILSNNARPFDMIKLSAPQPYSIPLIGLFKFNTFLTKLDYGLERQLLSSTIPHPYLWGTRLDFKPHPLLELGLSRIVMFGGEGREALGFGGYLKTLFSRTTEVKEGQNQQFAADFAFRVPNFDRILPIFRSLKVYGEWMMDDTTQWGYLAGLLLHDILLTGRMDLRLEYVDTSWHKVPTALDTHAEFPPIFHDRLFGYYNGGNVRGYFARIEVHLSPMVQLGLDGDAATQGMRLDVTTKTYRSGVDLEYLIGNKMSLKGRFMLEKLEDPQKIAGGNGTHDFLGMEFRKRF
jgi:hypothetical protein